MFVFWRSSTSTIEPAFAFLVESTAIIDFRDGKVGMEWSSGLRRTRCFAAVSEGAEVFASGAWGGASEIHQRIRRELGPHQYHNAIRECTTDVRNSETEDIGLRSSVYKIRGL
jgi:hypothetical protein